MNRILRCPDCNTPLVPGSSSCIKCNKQFSKPIPKIAEPKPAEPPIVPISVTPIVTPLKSAYKPQSKVLFATVLVVACLIALVTFVITQSQADEREALAQKQAYQQVLQNRTQTQLQLEALQQKALQAKALQEAARMSQPPPRPVYTPAPDVTTSQQGSTGSSGNSNQQQQAENTCFVIDVGTVFDELSASNAQEAISKADSLDNDADGIENEIPKLAPSRVDYWTQEVAKLRRKAEAEREDAQALPQSKY